MIKPIALITLLITSGPIFAANIDEALTLFNQQQDEQAMALLTKIDSAESAALQAQILMEQDLDDAEDFIETAIEDFPAAAELQYLRGRIMGDQAGNAIFSALSYAGKSLDSFTKAVEMEPDNVQYNIGLMMFYLNAPSFAGGDLEKAKSMIDTIKSIDTEQGLLMQFRYLRSTLEKDKAQHLKALVDENPNHPALYFELGQWLQWQDDYATAFNYFDKALKVNEGNDQSLNCSIWYQYGKTAGLANDKHDAGISYLDKYLIECQLTRYMPEKHWATFRQANIIEYRSAEKARNIYQSLKNIDDEHLKAELKKKKV